jgi:signal transduction histidine kinase
MRTRPGTNTIRGKITSLVLIPVIVLVGLWIFAVASMTGDLSALIRLEGVYKHFGGPVDTVTSQLQVERWMAAEYLGSGGDPTTLSDLTTQQHTVDQAVLAMRQAVASDSGRLSAEQHSRLDTMISATDGLTELRRKVIARQLPWDQAVANYTKIITPSFDVESALTALQAGQLAREAQVVVEMVRVREYVSLEDAIGAGARTARTLTEQQYLSLTAAADTRQALFRTFVPSFPTDTRQLFEKYARGPEYTALLTAENTAVGGGPAGALAAVSAKSWHTAMARAEYRYWKLNAQGAENSAARGRAHAVGELTQIGVAGGLGLVGVVLSIWYSVRTSRQVTRRLVGLRDAADVLATRQLPDVMRRLGSGEPVHLAAEAPPLTFGDDEIGQVGAALNTASRAALNAAVEQARLRHSVSAVFLNIARRSQALVHRQLKLVDTMERRSTDPDELADLYRIDHLTTRMRRHAEGLIILSGATPGRMWRQPIPMVDVVGAAVGEVEEYTRVVIPPMPKVGVVGAVVADLIHLLAELVENATAFSPSQAQVTMRVSESSHGVVLEIDDRGLGMSREELDEANHLLVQSGDLDLTRTDRLGLFVVSRLAQRHGVEITLSRSPYAGTTAIVFLPDAVLAGRKDVRGPGKVSELVENGPQDGTPPIALPSARLPTRTPKAAPRSSDATPDGPAPDSARKAPDASPAAGPAEPAKTPSGLPVRVRQAGLAPQLRTVPTAAPGGSAGLGDPADDEESAEQMRAIYGAFQRGLDRARSNKPADLAPAPADSEPETEKASDQ